MQTKFIIIVVITVLFVGGLGIFMNKNSNIADSGKLDIFAQCLKTNGAEFYGAFWCPHCQDQKKIFGSSKQYIPYIECSTPDGKEQNKVCKDKKIEGYPTWIFADGTQASGLQTLEQLSNKTKCPLP